MERIRRALRWLSRNACDVAFVVLAAALVVWVASDAFGARIKRETEMWAKVIRARNISIQ